MGSVDVIMRVCSKRTQVSLERGKVEEEVARERSEGRQLGMGLSKHGEGGSGSPVAAG